MPDYLENPAFRLDKDIPKLEIYDGSQHVPVADTLAINQDSAIFNTIPNFYKEVTGYNDYVHPTLSIIGLGSSVGVGATLDDPANQAPSAYLVNALGRVFNRLGNITFQHINGSVNGHVFADCVPDYTTAKASATGTVALVCVAFGMNDGTTASYHYNQTLPYVRLSIRDLSRTVKDNGGDLILFTTPHPHTTRTDFSYGGSVIYPSGQLVPDGSTAQSVKNITLPSGSVIPCSYRHLRVNELIRRTAAEVNATVIDVEKYWFEAVAKYGQNALFNTGEYVHPNLFGHRLSYHRAIDDWVNNIANARAYVANPTPLAVVTNELFNVQIANPVPVTTLIDKEYGILNVRARHPGWAGNHSHRMFIVVGESGIAPGGRVLNIGTIQGSGDDIVNVDVSSSLLRIVAKYDGTDIAFNYTRGFQVLLQQ